MTYMTPFEATVKMIYLAARSVVASVMATGAWIAVLLSHLGPFDSASETFMYLLRLVCAIMLTAIAMRHMKGLRRIATARDEEMSAR